MADPGWLGGPPSPDAQTVRPVQVEVPPRVVREPNRVVHLEQVDASAATQATTFAPEPFDLSLGRTALCHEWFTVYGGAEETAALIARTLGIRDVYTLVAEQSLVERLFDGPVRQTWIARLPHSRTNWSRYLPLMPAAWSSVDLDQYDTVITSSHAASNAVRTRPDARRICYCYTPMRYAWEWREEIGRVPRLMRPAWPLAASTFRRLDRGWASKVASFIVISEFIRQRVTRAYGRDAEVCHPPVDTAFFQPQGVPREDFYLWVGRMVAYKRADYAILAAARARRRLVLIGTGPELERLKRVPGAAEWAVFKGSVPREELRELLCSARALLFPGMEDFGIAMAEAQASGTPVVALGRGGATEIVTHGETGWLYDRPDPDGLAEAIRQFEALEAGGGFQVPRIRQNALRFARSTFPARFTAAIGSCL